jgi:hypothetical protein
MNGKIGEVRTPSVEFLIAPNVSTRFSSAFAGIDQLSQLFVFHSKSAWLLNSACLNDYEESTEKD